MGKIRIGKILPGWNYLEYLLLRGVSVLIGALPISFATWLAKAIGDLLFILMPKRRELALKNLTFAYRDSISAERKQAIARESFRNVAISLMEFFRMPSMLRDAKHRFEFEGTEHLDRAFEKGKGLIFVISHLGSWEYLAFLPYLRGYPCSVVVREIRNPYSYAWIQKLRFSTKLNPIDRNKSAREVLTVLKKNQLAAILIDQWAGLDGLWCEFFGRPTSTTSIPARLAVRTGAALVPGYCLRTGTGQYKIVIRPEISVVGTEQDYEKKTTLALNRQLEEEIKKYPEQWTWGHKRWKDLSAQIKPNTRLAGSLSH